MNGQRREPQSPNRRPVGYIVARALLELEHLEVVQRSVLRSFCPRGSSHVQPNGKNVNSVSRAFRNALADFEQAGWIERRPDQLIRVTDRAGLLQWANRWDPGAVDFSLTDPEMAAVLLRLARSGRSELHGRGLAGLDRLMRQPSLPARHRASWS